jgi:hypothetical protein
MLFAIPMAAGAIALAPKILYILSPKYLDSSSALVVLSLSALVGVVSLILDQSLTGRETADLQVEGRSRALLKSDLMFVPLVNLVFYIVYVVVIYVLARYSIGSPLPVSLFVTIWAMTQLVLMVAVVAVKARRLSRRMTLAVPPSIPVYLFSALAMSVLVYIVGYQFLPADLGNLVYGLRLALTILVGAVFYFGLVSLVDKRVRYLVRSVIQMIRWP